MGAPPPKCRTVVDSWEHHLENVELSYFLKILISTAEKEEKKKKEEEKGNKEEDEEEKKEEKAEEEEEEETTIPVFLPAMDLRQLMLAPRALCLFSGDGT